MTLLMYTKAPCLWTIEEWRMTDKERESAGIKLVKVKFKSIKK